jgi:hypothetical protein
MKAAEIDPILPTLTREGWDDFDMELADDDIHEILAALDAKSTNPGDFYADISVRLSHILGGLMAYAAVMHDDLVTLKKAMH